MKRVAVIYPRLGSVEINYIEGFSRLPTLRPR
jgi:hypothetical protein